MVASTPGVTAGSASVSAHLAVLACPPALCPHVEFAVAGVLEQPVGLRWVDQPALPGQLTAHADLSATPGTAGRLTSRLRTLGPVRFEVVESAGWATGQGGLSADGERYSFTPGLGLFRASLAAHGDVVVGEQALRALLVASHTQADAAVTLAHGIERLLGTAWDEELEPLRRGGHGSPVTWLRRTG